MRPLRLAGLALRWAAAAWIAPAWIAPAWIAPAWIAPAWIAPAWAEDRPPLAPSRDVVVAYRLSAPGAPPTEVRMEVRSGAAAMRFDMPDQTYLLVDLASRGVALVVPAEQTVLLLPWEAGPQQQFTLDPRMKFTRKGADTVAGLRCAVWDVLLDRARGTVCVTDDGVMLRSQGRNLIEATSVIYGTLNLGDFEPPLWYDRMSAAPTPSPTPSPPLAPPPAPTPAPTRPPGPAR